MSKNNLSELLISQGLSLKQVIFRVVILRVAVRNMAYNFTKCLSLTWHNLWSTSNEFCFYLMVKNTYFLPLSKHSSVSSSSDLHTSHVSQATQILKSKRIISKCFVSYFPYPAKIRRFTGTCWHSIQTKALCELEKLCICGYFYERIAFIRRNDSV